MDVDTTGLRVQAYIKLVLLLDEIATQKWLISIQGEGLYLEEPATVPTNDPLLVSDHLQPNRSRNGFYQEREEVFANQFNEYTVWYNG
jgi:hypothetical protein